MAFVGCNGVDPEVGITNVNLPEAEVKRAMLLAAGDVIVADGSKVGEVELAKVFDIEEVSLLITDATADPEVVAEIAAAGCQVGGRLAHPPRPRRPSAMRESDMSRPVGVRVPGPSHPRRRWRPASAAAASSRARLAPGPPCRCPACWRPAVAAAAGRRRWERLRVTFGSNQSDAVPRAYADMLAASGLTVKVNTVDHNTFQESINNYLQGNPDDVFTWFAGYRMRFFAAQGLAGDISDHGGTSLASARRSSRPPPATTASSTSCP